MRTTYNLNANVYFVQIRLLQTIGCGGGGCSQLPLEGSNQHGRSNLHLFLANFTGQERDAKPPPCLPRIRYRQLEWLNRVSTTVLLWFLFRCWMLQGIKFLFFPIFSHFLSILLFFLFLFSNFLLFSAILLFLFFLLLLFLTFVSFFISSILKQFII